jgi:hypothetical protein
MALRHRGRHVSLGEFRQATAGNGGTVPVALYRTNNTQLGNVLASMSGPSSQSGPVCATPVVVENNYLLVRTAMARAIAARVSGINVSQLLAGTAKVDQGALTGADRTSLKKDAATRFFNLAKNDGGRDARISTPESNQTPRASYCTVDVDH